MHIECQETVLPLYVKRMQSNGCLCLDVKAKQMAFFGNYWGW